MAERSVEARKIWVRVSVWNMIHCVILKFSWLKYFINIKKMRTQTNKQTNNQTKTHCPTTKRKHTCNPVSLSDDSITTYSVFVIITYKENSVCLTGKLAYCNRSQDVRQPTSPMLGRSIYDGFDDVGQVCGSLFQPDGVRWCRQRQDFDWLLIKFFIYVQNWIEPKLFEIERHSRFK